MTIDTVLPTSRHPVHDCSTSDLSLDTHHESENEPGLEADSFCGPIDSPFNTYYLGQDPHRPDALAGSIDWQTITTRTPGVNSPSFQEVLGGTGAFRAVSAAYSTYSDAYFDQGLHPAADEYAPQMAARPALPYPIGQMANLEADNSQSFSGMEQSHSISDVDRSLFGDRRRSSSAFVDYGRLTTWPELDHITPNSNQSNRGSFNLLSNLLEGASSRRSIESIPEDGKAALDSLPTNGAPAIIPELDTTTVSFPIKWFKIQQERYTPRRGTRPFLQPEDITFSVNNVPGLNMKNAFGQIFTGLDGRDDFVLENAKGPVSCRLLFPGYPPRRRPSQVAVRNWKRESAPITKSKLAYEVAKRVKQYLDEFAAASISPSVEPRRKIGQGCMKLEKMYLVSVAQVSKGSIQPEIWVDDS